MSRLSIRRGNTWVAAFQLFADDQTTPIDLTGYECRMQVRTLTGMYGVQDPDDTLVASYSTVGPAPALVWDTADVGRVVLTVSALDTGLLNPSNAAKARYAYGVEAYLPAVGPTPEVVVQLATGKLTVKGEVVR